MALAVKPAQNMQSALARKPKCFRDSSPLYRSIQQIEQSSAGRGWLVTVFLRPFLTIQNESARLSARRYAPFRYGAPVALGEP